MLKGGVKPVAENGVRREATGLNAPPVLVEESGQQNGILRVQLGGLAIGEGILGNEKAAGSLGLEFREGLGHEID